MTEPLSPDGPSPRDGPADPAILARAAGRTARRQLGSWRRRRHPSARQQQLPRGVRLLRPETTRIWVVTIAAIALSAALVPLLPALQVFSPDAFPQDTRSYVLRVATLFVAFIGLYSLLHAAATAYAYRSLSRADLIAAVRVNQQARLRTENRWMFGSREVRSESLQLLVTAGIAIILLVSPPQGVPLPLLLGFAVMSVIGAWVSSAANFAAEYAYEDRHRTAFGFLTDESEPPAWPEYAHIALMTQVGSPPSEVTARTRRARSLLGSQAVLAHITSTVLISMAVSVVVTVAA